MSKRLMAVGLSLCMIFGSVEAVLANDSIVLENTISEAINEESDIRDDQEIDVDEELSDEGGALPDDTCSLNDAETVVDSGNCGESLTWTLDENGVLKISGFGEMYDYGYYAGGPAPWDTNSVLRVVINDGVTSIGDFAFTTCFNLTEMSIPSSVRSIGEGAFKMCRSLTEAVIPDSVTSIETIAFSYCSALTSVKLPAGITTISKEVFYACSSLTSIMIPASVSSIEDSAFDGCSNQLVIIGTPGSYAESYAAQSGITFEPVRTDISKATVTVKAQTYTGKKLTPAPTVKLGSATLKKGTDYTVSYKGNLNVGTATVTVTGKGNYTGTAKGTFKITRAGNKITNVQTKYSKTLSYSKNAQKVITLSPKVKGGAAITYSISLIKKGSKKIKSGFTVSKGTVKTAKKLAKGTYTVQVKINAAATKNYKTKSKTVTLTVKIK